MAQWYVTSLFALEEVRVQVQIRAGLLPVFFVLFFFVFFFPFSVFFTLWLVSVYSHC